MVFPNRNVLMNFYPIKHTQYHVENRIGLAQYISKHQTVEDPDVLPPAIAEPYFLHHCEVFSMTRHHCILMYFRFLCVTFKTSCFVIGYRHETRNLPKYLRCLISVLKDQ